MLLFTIFVLQTLCNKLNVSYKKALYIYTTIVPAIISDDIRNMPFHCVDAVLVAICRGISR